MGISTNPDTTEGRSVIQSYLDHEVSRDHSNKMGFNTTKDKMIPLGTRNGSRMYRKGDCMTKSSDFEKDLGIIVDKQPNMSSSAILWQKGLMLPLDIQKGE